MISIQYVHYLFKRNLEHRYFSFYPINDLDLYINYIDFDVLTYSTLLRLIDSIGILKKFMGIRLHVFPCYDSSCMI